MKKNNIRFCDVFITIDFKRNAFQMDFENKLNVLMIFGFCVEIETNSSEFCQSFEVFRTSKCWPHLTCFYIKIKSFFKTQIVIMIIKCVHKSNNHFLVIIF